MNVILHSQTTKFKQHFNMKCLQLFILSVTIISSIQLSLDQPCKNIYIKEEIKDDLEKMMTYKSVDAAVNCILEDGDCFRNNTRHIIQDNARKMVCSRVCVKVENCTCLQIKIGMAAVYMENNYLRGWNQLKSKFEKTCLQGFLYDKDFLHDFSDFPLIQ